MSSEPDWAEVERLTAAVLEHLDWDALGEIYFHWGGSEFWEQRRPQVEELGLQLAQVLLPQLSYRGSSLWVGAGVAELPVLLAESWLTGRTVVASNLRERECEVLNAALAKAAPDVALRYVAGDARAVAGERAFDHIGCISVFSDPETWPLLSDVVYGRIAPAQLDVEQFARERDEARELARDLFARLARPGLVTTSAEEAAWFLEQAELVEAAIEASDDLVPTAVVGDPVGFLSVR